MTYSRHEKSGFTLIELLVVFSIISVLSSIVLGAVSSARANARDAQRIIGLRQINNALNLYFAVNNQYPSIFSGPGSTYCSAISNSAGADPFKTSLLPYLSSMPMDPQYDGVTVVLPYAYQYCVGSSYATSSRQYYTIWATQEKSNGNYGTPWPTGFQPANYKYVLSNWMP